MKSNFLRIAVIMSLGVCSAVSGPAKADDAPPLFGTQQNGNGQGQNGNGQGQNGGSGGFRWPANHTVIDKNHYFEAQDPYSLLNPAYASGSNGGPGDTASAVASAGLALNAVDETPSSKRGWMRLSNGSFQYIARAGHLIARAPTTSSGGLAANTLACNSISKSAGGGAEASIFYMAYTRDDIPAYRRPVTFIWNGGPGEPSIWQHLASWAPKALVVDGPPNLPNEPRFYPLDRNEQTLLDQSDLVFIDIVGAGFSEAILPHVNQDLWTTNCDAQVFRDFITAYINKYNRQSSPKFVHGESYGGIRTPIVANLLVQQGTSQYAPDPSGKPPVVLTGVTLQSPVLNYATVGGNTLPSEAMTADYFSRNVPAGATRPVATARGNQSEEDYANTLRTFNDGVYNPLVNGPSPVATTAFLNNLSAITGLPVPTLQANDPNSSPVSPVFTLLNQYDNTGNLVWQNYIGAVLYPNAQPANISFDAYDLRISSTNPALAAAPAGANNGPLMDNYDDSGFFGAIKPYLQSEFNYRPESQTQLYGADVASWVFDHTPGGTPNSPIDTSVPDLVEALTLSPKLVVHVFHGYNDSVCPFHQTELDLSAGGALPQFASNININVYDGGHMTYETLASRIKIRAILQDVYPPAPRGNASTDAANAQ